MGGGGGWDAALPSRPRGRGALCPEVQAAHSAPPGDAGHPFLLILSTPPGGEKRSSWEARSALFRGAVCSAPPGGAERPFRKRGAPLPGWGREAPCLGAPGAQSALSGAQGALSGVAERPSWRRGAPLPGTQGATLPEMSGSRSVPPGRGGAGGTKRPVRGRGALFRWGAECPFSGDARRRESPLLEARGASPQAQSAQPRGAGRSAPVGAWSAHAPPVGAASLSAFQVCLGARAAL